MHGRCGEMVKQGCCEQTTSTDHRPQLATTPVALPFEWTSYGALLAAAPSGTMPMGWAFAPHAESPPGRLSSSITILRI